MRLAFLQLACFAVLCLPWAIEKGWSSMPQTVLSHGRRMLLRTPYVLPKNASESQRLDAQHHLMQMVLGAPYLAPLNQPRTILDVGCGTGIWCREMGNSFPHATILGIDYKLEPLYAIETKLPRRARPANVFWRELDALAPLSLCSNTVDYIHLRFAATWIPRRQWHPVLSELYRILKPGGYLELTEGCMPASEDADYTALCKSMSDLLLSRGLSALVPEHLDDLLQMAGLDAVEQHTFASGGTAAQQHLLAETTMQGFKNLLPLLSKSLNPLDYAAYQTHLARVQEKTPHVTRREVVAWGRKPSNQ